MTSGKDSDATRGEQHDGAPLMQLRAWFDAVADLPGERREAWIVDNVADPKDRAKLMRLLKIADSDQSILDAPVEDYARDLTSGAVLAEALVGQRIGAFRLVRLLGQGGMAAVFLGAREDADFHQNVAIKLLRRGLYSELEQRLFLRERQVLASLNHPNVARLFDGGLTDAGIPYLVMEYVDGQSITRYAAQHRLDVAARLHLFLTVCRAVEAAHRALIVHRDIKPANILVAADGTVKLLDFGIAKLLEDNVQLGTIGIFTPDYAAPEQLTAQAVTTATDVYSLGVLLHELLLGIRPARIPSVRRPSAHVAADAHRSGEAAAPPDQLRKQLRGDLDNIIVKALAPDPNRRYASAGAFADDIERYLEGQPVVAHEPSRWYRARKFVARHRAGVLTAVVVSAAVLTALGVALWQAEVARRQAEIARKEELQAKEQAQRADAVQEFLVGVFEANTGYQSDPVKARATTAQQLLEIGAQKIDGTMKDAPDAKSNMLNLLAKLDTELGLYDEAAALSRKSIDVAHAAHGPYAIEAFEAQMALALSLHSSSSDEEAKRVLDDAQAALDRNDDHDPRRRGELFLKLAEYYTMRDTALTLDYARKSVDVFELLGPSNVLGDAFTHRARAEHQNGLDDAAIASYQRAVAVERQVNGDASPDLPVYYAELAEIQMQRHRIPEGLDSARKALQTAKAIEDEGQIDVIQCEMRLGRFLADSGQIEEGAALVGSARRKVLALRGPDDGFLTPAILYTSAFLMIRSGRIEEGLKDLDVAIASRRRARPNTLPLAQFLELSATARIELGDFAAAEQSLDESSAIRTKAGQNPPSQIFDVNVIARMGLALAQHQTARAAELATQLSVHAPHSDPLDRQSLFDQLRIAETLAASDDDDAAIALTQSVRHTIETSSLAPYYGAPSSRANYLEGLADLHKSDLRAATPLLQTSLKEQAQTLDPASPQILETEIALAEIFRREGDEAQSRRLCAAAAAIAASHPKLGPQYREPLQRLERSLGHH